MRNLLMWLFGAFLAFSLFGCIIKTKNRQESGFRFGSEISWYTGAQQTGDIESTVEIDVDPLVNNIIDLRGSEKGNEPGSDGQ